jgi:hypothetical protein
MVLVLVEEVGTHHGDDGDDDVLDEPVGHKHSLLHCNMEVAVEVHNMACK